MVSLPSGRCLAVAWVVATAVAAASAAEATAAADDKSEVTASGDRKQCGHFSDCGSCIRTPSCQWCASEDNVNSRCVDKENALGNWCVGKIFAPKSEFTILSDVKGHQIYPQKTKVSLRIGQTMRVGFSFHKSEDYPIDLYYLMDVSFSMRRIKDKLSKIGETLADAMRNITSNFRIGFGSFVDKVEMPFTLTSKKLLENPCKDFKCAPPYSFKNHMPLNNDTSLFSRRVEDTEMSSNLDSPEGGFDALMQALVCTDKIKWRSDARHLLFFTTDALYHLAGDGKLAGAVEPNPAKCLMNDKNEYTGDKDYDYPTISQISRKAAENKVNIIFAVTKEMSHAYSILSKSIKGSKSEALSGDSENLVQVITDVYNEFDKTLEIVDDSAGTGIGIVYHTRCSSFKNLVTTNICNNVHPGKPISFEVDISVQSCPPGLKNTTWVKSINISPQGVNEKFQLDVEVFCKCDCEISGHKLFQHKSLNCSNEGTYMCGICKCPEQRTGRFCECDQKSSVLEDTELKACITNKETLEVCNGRGHCLCDQCSCHKRQNPGEIISGKHCECDNFSCERIKGKMCSGHGHCRCGMCDCEAGWKGNVCECIDNQSECIAPGEDLVCSGHGRCGCLGCDCSDDRYGKYCGDCLSCPGGRCQEFADCVECMVYKTGKYAATSCANCTIRSPNIVKSISENLMKKERLCKIPDDTGCSFTFSYLEGTEVYFRSEKEKECSAAIPLWGVILGVTGSTLLLGIILIVIWKIITSIHDRREYEKYVAQLENTKWAVAENPLHQKPTTTTVNPTYNRKSRFSFMMRS